MGVSLGLSPLIIIVLGTVIAYGDEKVERAEFFIRFHRDEVIAFIRAKEMYEGSPTSISVAT